MTLDPLVPKVDRQAVGQLQSIAGTLVDPPTCVVRRVSNQSINDSTDTPINFLAGATVEVDTHSMFDTSDPDHITVKRDGTYLIVGQVKFPANTTGVAVCSIYVNSVQKARVVLDGNANTGIVPPATCIVACTTGQEIELTVRQTTGGAANCETADYCPKLSATWLRS